MNMFSDAVAACEIFGFGLRHTRRILESAKAIEINGKFKWLTKDLLKLKKSIDAGERPRKKVHHPARWARSNGRTGTGGSTPTQTPTHGSGIGLN